MSQDTISEESVVQFLTEFEKIAERKDFSLISEMIHERAFFRFNDGDFVGRQAVQGAFEKTWQGASKIRDERFYLSDIAVLSTDHRSASVTYTYNWEGVHESGPLRIQGRGTRVLIREQGRLQIIHEHLKVWSCGEPHQLAAQRARTPPAEGTSAQSRESRNTKAAVARRRAARHRARRPVTRSEVRRSAAGCCQESAVRC